DRGVTSMFSPGRGQLKPLDLAQGLKRECDDQIQVLDRTRTLAPNVFSVYLHAQDYDRFASWQDTLVEELERVLMEHAEKQRYMFVGGVSVTPSATTRCVPAASRPSPAPSAARWPRPPARRSPARAATRSSRSTGSSTC